MTPFIYQCYDPLRKVKQNQILQYELEKFIKQNQIISEKEVDCNKMLELIKNRIVQFEKLQDELSNFGARDTEPDGIFQEQLVRAVLGKSVKVPTGTRSWELYSGSGSGSASKRLHDACQGIVDLIQSCPNKEIKEYLKEYCWRKNL